VVFRLVKQGPMFDVEEAPYLQLRPWVRSHSDMNRLFSAAAPGTGDAAVIAAVNRCATQNQPRVICFRI
jgi:hypothetical protein